MRGVRIREAPKTNISWWELEEIFKKERKKDISDIKSFSRNRLSNGDKTWL